MKITKKDQLKLKNLKFSFESAPESFNFLIPARIVKLDMISGSEDEKRLLKELPDNPFITIKIVTDQAKETLKCKFYKKENSKFFFKEIIEIIN